MSDWTRGARPEQAAAIERMRAYLTPWPEALRALGGLQSKRVGAQVRAELWDRIRLASAGAIDGDGRLTALGAILADEEADRMFRDAFEI
jgi:hypothetical protein